LWLGFFSQGADLGFKLFLQYFVTESGRRSRLIQ
jgi:hypothetical protein